MNINPEQPFYDKFMPADMLMGLELPGETWQIDQLLTPGGKLLLSGPTKAGKSVLASQMVNSLANGRPFLGHFVVPVPLQVVYLQYEVTLRMMQTRLKKQATKLGPQFRVMPLINNRPSNDLSTVDHILRANDILDRQGRPIDVVVIDPMIQANEYDENSSKDMRLFTRELDQVIKELGCSIILIHHVKKGADGSQESARGSTQIIAWPNSILTMRLKNPKNKKGPRILGFDLRDAAALNDMVLTFDEPSLTFSVSDEPEDDELAKALEVMSEFPNLSENQQVKVLAERIKKSESTARRKLHIVRELTPLAFIDSENSEDEENAA